MARNNHNAGIHFVRWNHNDLDELEFYDRQAELRAEAARKKGSGDW